MPAACRQIAQGALVSQESRIHCNPVPSQQEQDQGEQEGAVHCLRRRKHLPRDLFWSILPVRCRNPSHLPTGEIQGFASVQSPQYTGQPVPPDDWAERNGSDIPLFWSEPKPIALWAAVIDDWKVATIFDCSPGSGALMEAAMTRGVFYHGLCLVLSS